LKKAGRVRLLLKIVLTLVICAAGLAGLTLAFSRGETRKTSDLFPQNQDCQPEVAALRIRLPYRYDRFTQAYAPDPELRTRYVTNCRRMGFQFFLKTLELTYLHYSHIAGDIWKKLYGVNGDGERDLIVHVSHVQPAVSILDPTIATNLYLLAFAHRLQRAYSRFDGSREPLAGYDLDRFRPYDAVLGRQDHKLYFLSRPAATVELVGTCEPPLRKASVDGSSWCEVLAYSQQDGLAFCIDLPHAELGRLNDIIERTLGLIRSWRVAA
jgi:hypothetical protein